MASKQRGSKKRDKAAGRTAPKKRAEIDRRALLGWLKVGGVAAVAVGGIGYYAVSSTMATLAEQDLGRVGNGTPAVVQIHDPQCAQCAALQREARAALAEIEPCALEYIVANVRTAEGARYARLHGVGHVTLLLLDGGGEVREVLSGPNSRARLAAAFAAHLEASAR